MKINVNINKEPVILLNGLTLQDLKAKYFWIFNAKIKNAVIGEQDNKLVWYYGDWLNGEWYDGIWYSGIFHEGIWYSGDFYSYNFNKDLLLTGNFSIQDKFETNSKFKKGIWKNGNFLGGTIGENINDVIWENGRFSNGIFKNSMWKKGTFEGGLFENSTWENGLFLNGEFRKNSIWKQGNWEGGDFIEGVWEDGIFDQKDNNKLSRFGVYDDPNSDELKCLWKNGTFKNGEFHSGLNIDSNGDVTISINDKISAWENGTFENGTFYGGQFKNGRWENGLWKNGIWGAWRTDWKIPKYIEQYNTDPYSGVTEETKELEINSIDTGKTSDFYNIYSTDLNFEVEFSGITYSTLNQIISFNDKPPFYYYTNMENIESGLTTYNFDPNFEIDNDGTNENPWDLTKNEPSASTVVITGGTLEYEQGNIDVGEYIIAEQDNIQISKKNNTFIDIDIDSWNGQDEKNYLFLRLFNDNGDFQDVEITNNIGQKTVNFKTEYEISKIQLMLDSSINENKININYLKIGETTYLYSNDRFNYTGNIYMEAKTNVIDNQEGDVHELLMNVYEMDNIEYIYIRLLDLNGESVGSVYEEDEMIIKDYYDINKTGVTNAFFLEDTDSEDIFFDFVIKRKITDQPYSLKFYSNVNTFRRSRIQTNNIKDNIFKDDLFELNITIYNESFTDPIDGYNIYKYYLINKDGSKVSSDLIKRSDNLESVNSNYFFNGVISATTFSEDYSLGVEIYRDGTFYNYDPFKSSFNIEVLKYIPETKWQNTENLKSLNDDYTYIKNNNENNPLNVLVLSGFNFNIVDENVDLKGFKIRIIRSGFFDEDIEILGGIKDRILSIDYDDFKDGTILKQGTNFKSNKFYSENDKSYTKNIIEYGNYEDFFGFNVENWDVDKINNDFKFIYQPQIVKNLRLSPSLQVEGRIYKIEIAVFYQTKPVWENGIWENGVWINGTFRNGRIKNINWINGRSLSGIFNFYE